MKANLPSPTLRLLAGLVAAIVPALLAAAPLTRTTAVLAKPEASASVLTYFNAGADPAPAPGVAAPTGWIAVVLPGPHEGYVPNRDLNKSLEVREGAAIHKEPTEESPVLTVATVTDEAEITGLRGKWTQISLKRDLIGYISVGPIPATAAASKATTPPPAPATKPAATQPPAPAQARTAPPPNTAPQTAVPPPPPPPSAAPAAPRLFQGKLTSTRRPFMPRRPYDYQLSAADGSRIAYVDLASLPPTMTVDPYVDHTVFVYGSISPLDGTSDLVIKAQSLQSQ